jgi:hypothetical protein
MTSILSRWLRGKKHGKRTRPNRLRLRLEQLENRLVPSVVNFANAGYTVNQNVNGGVLHVGVALDQASSNTVSLEVISAAFDNGDNASGGVDYTTVDQSISFSPGDTSVDVPVTILQNSAATGDLYFHLYLLGPIENGTAGDTDSTAITIHVPNPAPTLSNPGLQSANEGDSYALQIDATAPTGGGDLTYSASGLPAGLSVNTSTGLISGTIDYAAGETSAGNYSVTIGAEDGGGGSSSESFLMLVGDTNRPPTVTNPGGQTNAEGDTISLPISASDPDTDNTLTYSASGLPHGLAIDPATGVIAGIIAYDAGSNNGYSVTVSASDGLSSASQTFSWSVGDTNRLQNPGSQSVSAAQVVSLQLQASDTNGDPLTYSAGGLPTGLSVNAVTGLISGTVMYHNNASITSYVYVSGGGITDQPINFTWTVSGGQPSNPHVNYPPIISNPAEQDNGISDSVSLQVQASDPDVRADILTYSATGLPAGLSIDSNSGIISGSISNTANVTSPYSVTATVIDSVGHTASASFAWLIHVVTVTSPGDQTFYVGDDVSLTVGGSDSQGAGVRFSATGLPQGLGINPVTGEITGTIDEPATYNADQTYLVTLMAMNLFGQQDQKPMNMEVEDFKVIISPNPIVVGVGVALKPRAVDALVSPAPPAAVMNSIEFEVVSRTVVRAICTTSSAPIVGDEIVGSVKGLVATPESNPAGDCLLYATYKGKRKSDGVPIKVVVPKKIRMPTQGYDLDFNGSNAALNENSVPPVPK